MCAGAARFGESVLVRPVRENLIRPVGSPVGSLVGATPKSGRTRREHIYDF